MEPAYVEHQRALRNGIAHLRDQEWQAVQRMVVVFYDPGGGAMLLSLDGDEQHTTIAKFIQHELDKAI